MAEPTAESTVLETKAAFRLLDLPQEVILSVIAHVDVRDPSPTFPTGPCPELLRLAETNRWFHQECRARIWRSVRYVSESRYRPVEYRTMRSIATLRDLVRQRRTQGVTLPILALSVADFAADEGSMFGMRSATYATVDEEVPFLDLLQNLAQSTLQVLFMKHVELSRQGGERMLHAIRDSTTLSAIRFNQIDFWPDHADVVQAFPTLPRIKTLQVMHSDPELFQLVDKCPNLDSLLLWPSTRRIGPRIAVIKGLLPHLRLLSLDSVREAAAFRALADEIIVRLGRFLSFWPRCVSRCES